MSITETVLVFVCVPFAIAGVLALLVFGAGARRAPRYRPGRPFTFAPVWFLAAPPGGDSDHSALPLAPGRTALTTGAPVASNPAAGEPEARPTRPATKKGGARGTW